MNDIYTEIYKKSEPFWDTRCNDIHVPAAYHFGLQLLSYHPTANKAVVIPAILLHDNGWKSVPEERQKNAFGPKATDTEANRIHEKESERIAQEILTSLKYDRHLIDEICLIIEGHDSRKEALSLNDSLVKDADKLWRYTSVGIEIDSTRFEIELQKYIDWLPRMIKNWFFNVEAQELACELLSEARLKFGS